MKLVLAGLALIIAVPVAAQTTPPAKEDCCACCKDMKKDKHGHEDMKAGKMAPDEGTHADHDMSKMK